MAKRKRASVHFDRNKGDFIGLTDSVIDELKMKHPNVDVDDELARMRVWMSSPKGEKRDGKILFITTWLKNALEKRPVIREEPNKNSALSLLDIDPLWEKYLEGLWENCEHILEFNTMRR